MKEIEKTDYFAESKKDFYSKFSQESVLCQGRHRKKTPLVTIIITTYKRPELLKQALESALNQKGFDDYQVLIVDNEGKPIEEETPTARLLKDYKDEKVIYYRHFPTVNCSRSDAAIRLVRSPWFVFLHDDDLLAESHLAIMTGIIKKHKEIKYLGCILKSFTFEQKIERARTAGIYNYKVCKELRDTTCLGDWNTWLGALVSRKHYIAMGGTSPASMGVGDMIVTAKFRHHFGTYKCVTDYPLYYYRQGEQQRSYELVRNGIVELNRIYEYCFYKYAINKYHKLTHKIWERNIAYVTLEVCERYNNSSIYHANIDINRVISEAGMPADANEKGIRYYATKFLIGMYRKCIKYMDDIYMGKIKKSDVHITV